MDTSFFADVLHVFCLASKSQGGHWALGELVVGGVPSALNLQKLRSFQCEAYVAYFDVFSS